jgi:AcrR family transcriptional regulator
VAPPRAPAPHAVGVGTGRGVVAGDDVATAGGSGQHLPVHRPGDRRSDVQLRNRARIVDAAQRLFTERGFARTPVLVIAREAGVASTTVFNHFPHKEELFFHGRCPWAEISQHLADHPEAHTTAPELIAAVSDVVAGHLAGLGDACRRRSLEDLVGEPGLLLWESGLQREAERAISAHIARHGSPAVVPAADRCAALTIAEASTIVAEHRRAVLASGLAAAPVAAADVSALLQARLTDLRRMVLVQVADR